MKMVKGIGFDLDGTLYIGESRVEGALEIINALVSLNYQIFYFTNNSGKTRQDIINKLKGLGFPVKTENTYCGSYILSKYLKKFEDAYLIGSDDLKNELLKSGIKIKDSPLVSTVVVAFDRFFNYNKVTIALQAIENGAILIIANSDPSYPVEGNERLPGSGAMVGAVVGATNHIPDFCVGKPNTYMLELLCEEHNLLPEEICVVGDSPESDIEMADNFQCPSILFDPENVFPTFSGNKVKNLCEIIHLIKKGE